MAVNPVPLAIGSGAVHSDDVVRRMINGLSRDSHGVALPGDFKVTATPTASGTVNVAPGGMVLRHHLIRGQSYYADNPENSTVSAGLTTAGSHMIIARIIDPETSPWQPSGTPGAPNTNVANGPYFQLHVVTGVPSDAKTLADASIGYTAVPLARVDNPTGAGAITNAMIKQDGIRKLAQPRYWPEYDVKHQSSTQYVTVQETSFHHWPLDSFECDVPLWATHATVVIEFSVKANGEADVDMRCIMGNLPPGPISYIDYNGPLETPVSGRIEVISHKAKAEFDVRSLQGQRVTIRPDARRAYPDNIGDIFSEPTQQISFDVRFKELVV